MKLPSIILLLSALPHIQACMEFSGTFPFSHTLPFEASIIDNGVTTCWISTTLAEHNAKQDALDQESSKSRKSKRSVGRRILLQDSKKWDGGEGKGALPGPMESKSGKVDEKHVDLSAVPPPRNGMLPTTQKMMDENWDDRPVWQPWHFECISGYKAKANVGMRGFTYIAHGQDFFFIPKMREDLWGEKWVYSLKLWCGEKDKKGKIVERPEAKDEGKGKGKQEVKKQGEAKIQSGRKDESDRKESHKKESNKKESDKKKGEKESDKESDKERDRKESDKKERDKSENDRKESEKKEIEKESDSEGDKKESDKKESDKKESDKKESAQKNGNGGGEKKESVRDGKSEDGKGDKKSSEAEKKNSEDKGSSDSEEKVKNGL